LVIVQILLSSRPFIISNLIRIWRMSFFIFSTSTFLILLIDYFTWIVDLVIFDTFALEIFGTAITRLVKIQLLFLYIIILFFLRFFYFFVSIWIFGLFLLLLFDSIILMVYRIIHARSLCRLPCCWYRWTNSISFFAWNTTSKICVGGYWTRLGTCSRLLFLKFV